MKKPISFCITKLLTKCLESKHILLIFVLPLLTACSDNGSPSIKELITVAVPLFTNSQTTITLSTPNQTYILTGTCDSSGYGLEYSINDNSYQDVPGGCSATGTFSITVTVTRLETVRVRSRTKTSTTAAAVATIRYVLAPNAPLIGLVQGSTSGESKSSTVVMQSTTSGTMTGIPTTDSTNFILNTEITGVAYDQ